MNKFNSTMAQQIAQAASDFEKQRTGHSPTSVSVVLSEETLVITLHGALSPAETALSKSPAAAAQLQEFHRQLFMNSVELLRQEIKRITGVEVREATAEVEPTTGSVVHAFTTGTVVQVFLLAGGVPLGTWNGTAATAETKKHPASDHHRNAAAQHETAAHHYRQAAHYLESDNQEEAKKHANLANGHTQDADRHGKAAHAHSQK
jgi:uncharacterized protein YbcI